MSTRISNTATWWVTMEVCWWVRRNFHNTRRSSTSQKVDFSVHGTIPTPWLVATSVPPPNVSATTPTKTMTSSPQQAVKSNANMPVANVPTTVTFLSTAHKISNAGANILTSNTIWPKKVVPFASARPLHLIGSVLVDTSMDSIRLCMRSRVRRKLRVKLLESSREQLLVIVVCLMELRGFSMESRRKSRRKDLKLKFNRFKLWSNLNFNKRFLLGSWSINLFHGSNDFSEQFVLLRVV